jgi:hypothetical protein
MPTLLERANAAVEPDFVSRVTSAMLTVAEEVNEEDHNEPENDARRRLMQQVFQSPGLHAPTMAQRVVLIDTFGSAPGDPAANDPANDSEAGDGALIYVVRTLWTDLALALGLQ